MKNELEMPGTSLPGNLELNYVNHAIHDYKKYVPYGVMADIIAQEMIISCIGNIKTGTSFTEIKNINQNIYAIHCDDDRFSIRIPIKYIALNFYFENYKDYYFLPNENMCVLKSVAEGVAKQNRENATKENCKVYLTSKFIYAFQSIPSDIKKFKAAHNSKHEYIRLEDFISMSDPEKSDYVNSILSCFYR